MIINISFTKNDGSVYYVDSEEDINKIISALPRGLSFKRKADIKSLHNKYFYLVEKLRKNVAKEYSKVEFPEVLKDRVFNPLKDMKHLFKDGKFEYSTKNLTTEGYSYLIDSLKTFALDTFGFTLE